MNRKTTKRALGLSFVSLLLCFTMLMGTTFAWFTDNATVAVNTIQAGTLDIKLLASNDESEVNEPTNSLENQTLKFVDEKGNGMTGILFEPGARFNLQQVWLYNAGNLHAKYKVVISGIDGDEELAKVLDVYVNGQPTNKTLAELAMTANGVVKENTIAPKQFDTFGTITLKMQESAGNEYQGETIEGIAITVYATQAAAEYDSFNNTYDANAEYFKMLNNAEDLKDFLASDKSEAMLANDITVDGVVNITDNKVLNLNGKKLTVTEENGLTVGENATLTVAGGTVAFSGADHAPFYLTSNGTINIGEGTTIDVTSTLAENEWGTVAAVYVNQGSNSTVNINGGTINATGICATGVFVGYANGGNHTVNFNGGTINVDGIEAIGLEVLSTNTLNLNGGTITVKGSGNVAFNVGQSQGKPTVVTGNGNTVVNLHNNNVACDTDDAAQFAGVSFTVNNK